MTAIVENYEVTRLMKRTIRVVCDGCGVEIAASKLSPEFGFVLECRSNRDGQGNFTVGWELPHLCQTCISRLKMILVAHDFSIIETGEDWTGGLF